MENASKALLIAGSALISVLVISLIVAVYGQISNWQQQVDDSEQVITDTEFMLQVQQFNRVLYGSELLSLMNFVENYNTLDAGDGYSEIELNVQFTNSIQAQGSYNFFSVGTYTLEELYDEVKGSRGIETLMSELEESQRKYNNKSVKYYWTKTYREIASEFGIEIPSSTANSELRETLLANAGTKRSTIEDLLEDISNYDILNSIYTQFKEGKRFKPADDNGFVYDSQNGRVIQINFVEI